MGTGKSVEYFPHDCNAKDDPKIMLMMAQLGLEAYGIYWVLIEYLRDQTDYRAPMVLLDPLSRRYGSSREKFEIIVTKFNLFEYNDLMFWSPSLKRRMEFLAEKRIYMSNLAKKRWSDKCEKDAHALPAHSVRNASKVKESKVKESKVKESKKEEIDFSSNFNQLLFQKWEEWVSFRKQIKKPYKTKHGEAISYNKLCNLAEQDSETAISIIQQSIDNEWVGFFPIKPGSNKNSIRGEDPVDKMVRETMEIINKTQKSTTNGAQK